MLKKLNFTLSSKYFPWIIAAAAIVLRLVLFPFSDVVDSDAVSRVLIAEMWLLNPSWIQDGIWGPFHTYLNAIAIFISGNRTTAPIVLHILFGGLIALPIYRFSARLFNTTTAGVVATIFVFTPLVIRNSLQPMAEVPYAFFVATSMWFILKGIQEQLATNKWFLFGGLSLTIAAGMRYEAWVLIALFTLVISLNGKWKHLIWFWLTSMIFPFLWMLGNYIQYQNILYGIDYATHYNVVVHGVNDNQTLLLQIQRFIFFPVSLLHIYPLGLLALLIPVLIYKIVKRELSKIQLTWLIPFLIMMLIFIFKAMGGTLLLQHRFSITLFLLLISYTAVILPKNPSIKLAAVVLLVVGLHLKITESFKRMPYCERVIPASIVEDAFSQNRWQTFNQLQSVPHLRDENTVAGLLKKTNKYRMASTPLMLDFFGWENTYNFTFNSEVDAEKIVYLSPDVLSAEQNFEGLQRFYLQSNVGNTGVLLLKKGSRNMQNVIVEGDQNKIRFDNGFVPIHIIDSVESIYIFKFDTEFLKKEI